MRVRVTQSERVPPGHVEIAGASGFVSMQINPCVPIRDAVALVVATSRATRRTLTEQRQRRRRQ